MATDKKTAQEILECLAPLGNVGIRAMMGDYVLYYRERVIGGIYDNDVLLKKSAALSEKLPNAQYRTPYAGAKEMMVLEVADDLEEVKQLFETVYSNLPAARKKRG